MHHVYERTAPSGRYHILFIGSALNGMRNCSIIYAIRMSAILIVTVHIITYSSRAVRRRYRYIVGSTTVCLRNNMHITDDDDDDDFTARRADCVYYNGECVPNLYVVTGRGTAAASGVKRWRRRRRQRVYKYSIAAPSSLSTVWCRRRSRDSRHSYQAPPSFQNGRHPMCAKRSVAAVCV